MITKLDGFLTLALICCFLLADAQEVGRKAYKSSRKLVETHLCKECLDDGGLPGLPDIQKSKSEMEIRWFSRNHGGKENALKITRQNNVYEAHIYLYQRVNTYDRVKKEWFIRSFKYNVTGHDLDSVMNALTQAGIFTLPDQTVTKTRFFKANEVHFKVNDEVRKYSFGYVDENLQKYPDEVLFKKYDALLKIFYALTKEAFDCYHADMEIESKRINKLAKKNLRMRRKEKGLD